MVDIIILLWCDVQYPEGYLEAQAAKQEASCNGPNESDEDEDNKNKKRKGKKRKNSGN